MQLNRSTDIRENEKSSVVLLHPSTIVSSPKVEKIALQNAHYIQLAIVIPGPNRR